MMIPSIWDTPFRYVVIRSICDSLLLFNELVGKLRLSDVSCIWDSRFIEKMYRINRTDTLLLTVQAALGQK